jgi:hypothetical protein
MRKNCEKIASNFSLEEFEKELKNFIL